MKNLSLFFVILVPIFCFAQLNENFSDGNFINNPIWTGATSNFVVNSSLQLQSQATTTSTSYLFTPSEAINEASWECWVKIKYSTSSSNYATIYIISDRADITAGCNGYYVQIGGTNDEVSLFLQEGTKKTKIIDGIDKRTDGSVVEVKIIVTRDATGNFKLYSKLATESDYVLEGAIQNSTFSSTKYFGLLYANTTTTGFDYFFDDIVVTGIKMIDSILPTWTALKLLEPNQLILNFSEPIDLSSVVCNLQPSAGELLTKALDANKQQLTFTYSGNFQRGTIYSLQLSGIKDVAGNEMLATTKSFGIIEKIEIGDLVFNEVMFDNPLNSLEYIEFYNRSEKLLDVSGMIFTTRKTDKSLNTGNKIPASTVMLPNSYTAFCAKADSLRNYHHCPLECNIITTGWSTLNNESATLVLTNSTKDTIYDELTYSVKWHHPLINSCKGVSLERINPLMSGSDPASWHSAASEYYYGTPGYKNSQYRDISNSELVAKTVWADPEAFSPDNDGTDDVCFINYRTNADGYVANVFILNQVGAKMIQLASNILLASEGKLIWDGKTQNGLNANVGIYVVYFEMFNPQNGSRKQLKIPVVVSSR